MEISHSLSATVGLVVIATLTLLFAFLLKKKRKCSGDAEIFECGENPIGSATRQYRVEFIYSMIKSVLLISMAMVLFYWVVQLVVTDSKGALVGSIVTSILWLLIYLYTVAIGTRD